MQVYSYMQREGTGLTTSARDLVSMADASHILSWEIEPLATALLHARTARTLTELSMAIGKPAAGRIPATGIHTLPPALRDKAIRALSHLPLVMEGPAQIDGIGNCENILELAEANPTLASCIEAPLRLLRDITNASQLTDLATHIGSPSGPHTTASGVHALGNNWQHIVVDNMCTRLHIDADGHAEHAYRHVRNTQALADAFVAVTGIEQGGDITTWPAHTLPESIRMNLVQAYLVIAEAMAWSCNQYGQMQSMESETPKLSFTAEALSQCMGRLFEGQGRDTSQHMFDRLIRNRLGAQNRVNHSMQDLERPVAWRLVADRLLTMAQDTSIRPGSILETYGPFNAQQRAFLLDRMQQRERFYNIAPVPARVFENCFGATQ